MNPFAPIVADLGLATQHAGKVPPMRSGKTRAPRGAGRRRIVLHGRTYLLRGPARRLQARRILAAERNAQNPRHALKYLHPRHTRMELLRQV